MSDKSQSDSDEGQPQRNPSPPPEEDEPLGSAGSPEQNAAEDEVDVEMTGEVSIWVNFKERESKKTRREVRRRRRVEAINNEFKDYKNKRKGPLRAEVTLAVKNFCDGDFRSLEIEFPGVFTPEESQHLEKILNPTSGLDKPTRDKRCIIFMADQLMNDGTTATGRIVCILNAKSTWAKREKLTWQAFKFQTEDQSEAESMELSPELKKSVRKEIRAKLQPDQTGSKTFDYFSTLKVLEDRFITVAVLEKRKSLGKITANKVAYFNYFFIWDPRQPFLYVCGKPTRDFIEKICPCFNPSFNNATYLELEDVGFNRVYVSCQKKTPGGIFLQRFYEAAEKRLEKIDAVEQRQSPEVAAGGVEEIDLEVDQHAKNQLPLQQSISFRQEVLLSMLNQNDSKKTFKKFSMTHRPPGKDKSVKFTFKPGKNQSMDQYFADLAKLGNFNGPLCYLQALGSKRNRNELQEMGGGGKRRRTQVQEDSQNANQGSSSEESS